MYWSTGSMAFSKAFLFGIWVNRWINDPEQIFNSKAENKILSKQDTSFLYNFWQSLKKRWVWTPKSDLCYVFKTHSLSVDDTWHWHINGLFWWLNGKESTCQWRRRGFHPWVRKIAWRRKWQCSPGFLSRKSNRQRRLVGTVHGLTKSRTRLSTSMNGTRTVWWPHVRNFAMLHLWYSYCYFLFQKEEHILCQ